MREVVAADWKKVVLWLARSYALLWRQGLVIYCRRAGLGPARAIPENDEEKETSDPVGSVGMMARNTETVAGSVV